MFINLLWTGGIVFNYHYNFSILIKHKMIQRSFGNLFCCSLFLLPSSCSLVKHFVSSLDLSNRWNFMDLHHSKYIVKRITLFSDFVWLASCRPEHFAFQFTLLDLVFYVRMNKVHAAYYRQIFQLRVVCMRAVKSAWNDCCFLSLTVQNINSKQKKFNDKHVKFGKFLGKCKEFNQIPTFSFVVSKGWAKVY